MLIYGGKNIQKFKLNEIANRQADHAANFGGCFATNSFLHYSINVQNIERIIRRAAA
jgi:hypothetical protein